jgi:hypothetical protein
MARTVYFDDAPDQVTTTIHDHELGREVHDNLELPEDQRVKLHLSSDCDTASNYGVTYQRCGGGRRVIRKHIGGN